MRTIFISPLLWQRLNRAVRRREEGQAIVLIALAAVALVAIVGLSVDGGMTFWEAQKLQRAADAAALAGVVWVPSQQNVADSRGRLTVQSAGYNNFATSGSNQVAYTYTDVDTNPPGAYTAYWGTVPTPYQYKVTLGTKIPHYFLGVLGFQNSYLQREALAEYAVPAQLGGSFNYFGSSSLRYDWLIRNEAYQSTQPERKDYYNTLWQRYVGKRCDQNPTPTPCVGTFWLNTQGPETRHENGDAYDPMGDGVSAVTSGGPYSGLGGVLLSGGNNTTVGNCKRVSDLQTWWYTLANGSGTCDKTANNFNLANKDRHPDSPDQNTQGFGYSIAVQLDSQALYNFTGDPAQNYTSLRVSVYDAAWSDIGNGELFNSGDNSFGTNNPYSGRPDTNITSSTNYSDRQRPAATGSGNDRGGNRTINCITTDLPTTVANESRTNPNNSAQVITGGTVNADNRYCQNGYRTRFSLYYPPTTPGVPTSWRTKGDLVAAWEATDLTAQNEAWDAGNATGGASGTSRYCYYADTSFDKTTGSWAKLPTSSIDSTFVYACPSGQGGGNLDDIYWNATPSSTATWQNPQTSPATSTYYQARLQGLTTDNARFDPSQGCRSVVDPNLYNNVTATYNNALNLTGAVSPPYRNIYVPWNLRGADDKLTGAAAVYKNVQGFGNLTGGYQSYHGWRCSWDFDSGNTLNPGPTGYNSIGDLNDLRQPAEGIGNQPYLYISDYGYIPGDATCGAQLCRIAYKGGVRQKAAAGDSPNVRNGVYLLQAQVFGGGGTNRYAVKAEYDNPKTVNATFVNPTTGATVTQAIWPVPQVYGITAMNIFVNAVNNNAGTLNVIFDLAYIPRQNAGALATLELFDAGDVNTDLSVEILQPSGYGQKLNAGAVPYNFSDRLSARPAVCPSQGSAAPFPRGASVQCVFPSSANVNTIIKSGGSYFNDQWLYLIFRIPDSTAYDTIQSTCFVNRVPDSLCYYYQINYKMAGSGSANDTTTWQLSIKNQPVHLTT